MSAYDFWKSDNSANEDADYAWEQANESLGHELRKCKSLDEVRDLWAEIMEHAILGTLNNRAVRAREEVDGYLCDTTERDEAADELVAWTERNPEALMDWAGVVA